jgi:hypothetical protein
MNDSRKLKIDPLIINGIPTCHDGCESRCLKSESQIGRSGCYAWKREIMGECPENPTLCEPWEHAGFRVEISLENTKDMPPAGSA